MDRSAIDELQMHGQDIPWLLAHWAEQRADHLVLVWDPADGEGRSWTYAELWADTRRLAAGLAARGIGRDDKVLIHSENCPEMVLAWLACATVGDKVCALAELRLAVSINPARADFRAALNELEHTRELERPERIQRPEQPGR